MKPDLKAVAKSFDISSPIGELESPIGESMKSLTTSLYATAKDIKKNIDLLLSSTNKLESEKNAAEVKRIIGEIIKLSKLIEEKADETTASMNQELSTW